VYGVTSPECRYSYPNILITTMKLLRRPLHCSSMILFATFCTTRAAFGFRAASIVAPHLTKATLSSSSTWPLQASSKGIEGAKKPVPMTLLSGFLGTGKTCALQHLLENKEKLKIGVIVNDVASINIDAKLIAGQSNGDMIELQNGCACCSLQDELFFSVEKLIKGRDLDAVVVELSGVADPAAIQSNWKAAPDVIREMADIYRVVTLVDACTFGTDYMTWDMAGQRQGWVMEGDDCTGNRKVSELLAEQVEAANLILVNKVDVASTEQVKVATAVARALNSKAELAQVQYGRISPQLILGTPKVEQLEVPQDCDDPAYTDTSHSHSHDHEHAAVDCNAPECTDTSHSHSHEHEPACNDPDCTDESHDHSNHLTESTCDDPTCTDESHSHSHSHDHRTSTDALGIVNFVYTADRPFNAVRLMEVLNQWPVPIKETLDLGVLQEVTEYEVGGRLLRDDSPFTGVLRSKGFCWFAPHKWSGANHDAWRHDTAMYWSHAGRQFGISSAGKWWATLPDSKMKKYFTENMDEYERIKREDFKTEEFGDRRQEIVFIGTKLNEDEITATLNSCLCNEREMGNYRQKLRNFMDAAFTTAPSQGLFGVGSVDHADL
jgi:G3E family GTPase